MSSSLFVLSFNYRSIRRFSRKKVAKTVCSVWPERQYEALSFIFRGTVVSKEKDTINRNEFVKKRKKFAIKFRVKINRSSEKFIFNPFNAALSTENKLISSWIRCRDQPWCTEQKIKEKKKKIETIGLKKGNIRIM